MKQTHILILEDAPIVREGLKSLLDSMRNVHSVSIAGTFEELMHMLECKSFQMVLIGPHYLLIYQSQIQQLRSQHNSIKWIGVQYSLFSEDLLNKFDGVVDVFDDQEILSQQTRRGCVATARFGKIQ